MGLDVTTTLMLGIKFEQDEIPEAVLDYYAEQDNVIHKKPEIRIVRTNGWGDPCYIIIGFVIGSVDEMEDTVVQKEVSFIENFAETIQAIIYRFLNENKIDPLYRKVALLMFNEFS